MKKPMSGLEQATSMARLAGYVPDQLAGFRVNDLVDLPSLGRCQIVELHPPALLVVRTSTGARAKVGWRAASKVSNHCIVVEGAE